MTVQTFNHTQPLLMRHKTRREVGCGHLCGVSKRTVGTRDSLKYSYPKASLCTLFWHSRPLGLPEVIMNGQGVHTDGHSLGRYDGELFAVRAVLVELIDHLLGDAFWPSSSELVYLFCVRKVRVECPELAATITEEDH